MAFEDSLINILARGITASLAIIIGALFFSFGRNGAKVPILFGRKNLNRGLAFVFFIISIYVIAWFSEAIEYSVKEFMLQNRANIVIGIILPLAAFFAIFNLIFYRR